MKLVFAGNGLTKILVIQKADRWLRSYFMDQDGLVERYVHQFVPLEPVVEKKKVVRK